MQRAYSQFAFQHSLEFVATRAGSKRIRAIVLACASNLLSIIGPAPALAGPSSFVEFDIAPTAECRDVTPQQRIVQYPNQRLIEVALPVSVRFRGLSMDEVDELAIEVNGSYAGMRVHDFAPTTQLFSDVAHEIETTTTTTKKRSFDGSLGGIIPIPGADAAAHLTPSLSAGLSNCDTETEKMNRLPPKHAVVVSGTSSSGRGVFFKLKRYSQTSLEGVHELTVTFVAPRAWKWSDIRVDCAAYGEQKLLWMKQSGTVGRANRTVQLVEATAKPMRQTVLKPADDNKPATAKTETKTERPSVTTVSQWRPTIQKVEKTATKDPAAGEPESKSDKTAEASPEKTE